jgi:transcriptional regulator with XRE-family HTH domain
MRVSTLRLQFGRNLRTLRLSHDWTQEELAERLGVSVNFLSYMERGLKAPSFENLERMAEVLNLPVADLFAVKLSIPRGVRVRRTTHGAKKRNPTKNQ